MEFNGLVLMLCLNDYSGVVSVILILVVTLVKVGKRTDGFPKIDSVDDEMRVDGRFLVIGFLVSASQRFPPMAIRRSKVLSSN